MTAAGLAAVRTKVAGLNGTGQHVETLTRRQVDKGSVADGADRGEWETMSRNPDQIRREIEQTRAQLAQNLEAIGDRVSPKHVKEQIAEKASEISDKVNPRRVLARQTSKLRDTVSGVGDSITGRASGALDDVRGSLKGAAGSASQTASAAGGGVRQQAQTLKERGRGLSTDVVGQVRGAPQDNPMATALVVFGASLVVGLALPPSQKERQAADMVRGRVVEPVKGQAVEAGKAVAGELQPAVRAKAERVKRTATSAAARVKGEAKAATGEVQGQAAAAAEQVKGQATRAAKTTRSQAKSAAATTKTSVKRSAGQVRKRASV